MSIKDVLANKCPPDEPRKPFEVVTTVPLVRQRPLGPRTGMTQINEIGPSGKSLPEEVIRQAGTVLRVVMLSPGKELAQYNGHRKNVIIRPATGAKIGELSLKALPKGGGLLERAPQKVK